MLLSTALFTWLIGMRVLGLTPADLRYRRRAGGRRLRGSGWPAGALAAGDGARDRRGCVGGAEWIAGQRRPGRLRCAGGATTILVLAPAALSEEVMFRGVPLVLLAARARAAATAIVLRRRRRSRWRTRSTRTSPPLAIGNIALAGRLPRSRLLRARRHLDRVRARTSAGTRCSPRSTRR